MKRLITAFVVLILSLNLSAQYKKAGFFEKEGRTYEIGSQLYMMGQGNGNSIGYKIAFGRDRDGKNLFSSWNLQFIPSHKYSYTTVDENDVPVSVSGSSKSYIVYGLNYGYHLLKNDAEDKPKVQPYVNAGINFVLLGGIKEETISPDTYSYPKRSTSDQSLSMGISGGVGSIFNLSSKWAIKAEAGYDHQFNFSTSNWDDEVKPFYLFNSHTYVSLGLRLRIVSE
jgi:hypothetical protein